MREGERPREPGFMRGLECRNQGLQNWDKGLKLGAQQSSGDNMAKGMRSQKKEIKKPKKEKPKTDPAASRRAS